jgi:uncharacterized membrane protein YidH (DUF202 family)
MENEEIEITPVVENEAKLQEKAERKLFQNERTRTAFEKLQLAWIRTSLTLIIIGVGLLEYYMNRIEEGKKPYFNLITGNELGFFLIITSTLMLILVTLQHVKSMSQLKVHYPEMRYSVATILSILILSLCFFLFLMIYLKL